MNDDRRVTALTRWVLAAVLLTATAARPGIAFPWLNNWNCFEAPSAAPACYKLSAAGKLNYLPVPSPRSAVYRSLRHSGVRGQRRATLCRPRAVRWRTGLCQGAGRVLPA